MKINYGDIVHLGENRIIFGDATDNEIVDKCYFWPTPVDAAIIDPPYDNENLYNVIPEKKNMNSLILINGPKNFFYGSNVAISRGWTPKFEFIWDGCVSLRKKNEPLYRHKSAKIFTTNMWNFENSIYHTKGSSSTNFIRRNYKYLQSVYSENFAKMNKSHKHEKPFNWIRGIFGGLNFNHIVDFFAGSGVAMFACMDIGSVYTGIEIEKDLIESIVNRFLDQYPGVEIKITRH